MATAKKKYCKNMWVFYFFMLCEYPFFDSAPVVWHHMKNQYSMECFVYQKIQKN